MQSVTQIKIGKNKTGFVGFEKALTELVTEKQDIRDIKEISKYGVMRSPALLINGKIKAVGSVSSKIRPKNFILEAIDDL